MKIESVPVWFAELPRKLYDAARDYPLDQKLEWDEPVAAGSRSRYMHIGWGGSPATTAASVVASFAVPYTYRSGRTATACVPSSAR